MNTIKSNLPPKIKETDVAVSTIGNLTTVIATDSKIADHIKTEIKNYEKKRNDTDMASYIEVTVPDDAYIRTHSTTITIKKEAQTRDGIPVHKMSDDFYMGSVPIEITHIEMMKILGVINNVELVGTRYGFRSATTKLMMRSADNFLYVTLYQKQLMGLISDIAEIQAAANAKKKKIDDVLALTNTFKRAVNEDPSRTKKEQLKKELIDSLKKYKLPSEISSDIPNLESDATVNQFINKLAKMKTKEEEQNKGEKTGYVFDTASDTIKEYIKNVSTETENAAKKRELQKQMFNDNQAVRTAALEIERRLKEYGISDERSQGELDVLLKQDCDLMIKILKECTDKIDSGKRTTTEKHVEVVQVMTRLEKYQRIYEQKGWNIKQVVLSALSMISAIWLIYIKAFTMSFITVPFEGGRIDHMVTGFATLTATTMFSLCDIYYAIPIERILGVKFGEFVQKGGRNILWCGTIGTGGALALFYGLTLISSDPLKAFYVQPLSSLLKGAVNSYTKYIPLIPNFSFVYMIVRMLLSFGDNGIFNTMLSIKEKKWGGIIDAFDTRNILMLMNFVMTHYALCSDHLLDTDEIRNRITQLQGDQNEGFKNYTTLLDDFISNQWMLLWLLVGFAVREGYVTFFSNTQTYTASAPSWSLKLIWDLCWNTGPESFIEKALNEIPSIFYSGYEKVTALDAVKIFTGEDKSLTEDENKMIGALILQEFKQRLTQMLLDQKELKAPGRLQLIGTRAATVWRENITPYASPIMTNIFRMVLLPMLINNQVIPIPPALSTIGSWTVNLAAAQTTRVLLNRPSYWDGTLLENATTLALSPLTAYLLMHGQTGFTGAGSLASMAVLTTASKMARRGNRGKSIALYGLWALGMASSHMMSTTGELFTDASHALAIRTRWSGYMPLLETSNATFLTTDATSLLGDGEILANASYVPISPLIEYNATADDVILGNTNLTMSGNFTSYAAIANNVHYKLESDEGGALVEWSNKYGISQDKLHNLAKAIKTIQTNANAFDARNVVDIYAKDGILVTSHMEYRNLTLSDPLFPPIGSTTETENWQFADKYLTSASKILYIPKSHSKLARVINPMFQSTPWLQFDFVTFPQINEIDHKVFGKHYKDIEYTRGVAEAIHSIAQNRNPSLLNGFYNFTDQGKINPYNNKDPLILGNFYMTLWTGRATDIVLSNRRGIFTNTAENYVDMHVKRFEFCMKYLDLPVDMTPFDNMNARLDLIAMMTINDRDTMQRALFESFDHFKDQFDKLSDSNKKKHCTRAVFTPTKENFINTCMYKRLHLENSFREREDKLWSDLNKVRNANADLQLNEQAQKRKDAHEKIVNDINSLIIREGKSDNKLVFSFVHDMEAFRQASKIETDIIGEILKIWLSEPGKTLAKYSSSEVIGQIIQLANSLMEMSDIKENDEILKRTNTARYTLQTMEKEEVIRGELENIRSLREYQTEMRAQESEDMGIEGLIKKLNDIQELKRITAKETKVESPSLLETLAGQIKRVVYSGATMTNIHKELQNKGLKYKQIEEIRTNYVLGNAPDNEKKLYIEASTNQEDPLVTLKFSDSRRIVLTEDKMYLYYGESLEATSGKNINAMDITAIPTEEFFFVSQTQEDVKITTDNREITLTPNYDKLYASIAEFEEHDDTFKTSNKEKKKSIVDEIIRKISSPANTPSGGEKKQIQVDGRKFLMVTYPPGIVFVSELSSEDIEKKTVRVIEESMDHSGAGFNKSTTNERYMNEPLGTPLFESISSSIADKAEDLMDTLTNAVDSVTQTMKDGLTTTALYAGGAFSAVAMAKWWMTRRSVTYRETNDRYSIEHTGKLFSIETQQPPKELSLFRKGTVPSPEIAAYEQKIEAYATVFGPLLKALHKKELELSVTVAALVEGKNRSMEMKRLLMLPRWNVFLSTDPLLTAFARYQTDPTLCYLAGKVFSLDRLDDIENKGLREMVSSMLSKKDAECKLNALWLENFTNPIKVVLYDRRRVFVPITAVDEKVTIETPIRIHDGIELTADNIDEYRLLGFLLEEYAIKMTSLIQNYKITFDNIMQ